LSVTCEQVVMYTPPPQKSALRVEWFPARERCLLALPADWSDKRHNAGSLWYFSGGEVYIFGQCVGRESVRCPMNQVRGEAE